jgi:ATP-dependent DNA helicase RecQ
MSKYRGDELGLILQEDWDSAREKTIEQFSNSTNLELTLKIIDHFKNTNPKIFLSEWNSYLYEIRIEDFYFPEKDIIMVSTMHKAKGKEFDNVYLLPDN